jgi:Cu-Zn family superoxide dismutase
MRKMVVILALCASAAAWAGAQPGSTASGEFKNTRGETVGHARLAETPSGVLITIELRSIPAGVHAFHIHESGRCDPPDFKSAGEHFSTGTRRHGFKNPDGFHAGDLPNVHVPGDGTLKHETLAEDVTLGPGRASLLDGDGASLVLHVAADDYRTDPAGASGDRIACAVIRR